MQLACQPEAIFSTVSGFLYTFKRLRIITEVLKTVKTITLTIGTPTAITTLLTGKNNDSSSSTTTTTFAIGTTTTTI